MKAAFERNIDDMLQKPREKTNSINIRTCERCCDRIQRQRQPRANQSARHVQEEKVLEDFPLEV